MIAQRNAGEVRYPGERQLNGGASYTIVGGLNSVNVIFSRMNDYCAERVRNEIAKLVHRYFSETQRKPGGIRTFRRPYREERNTLMPAIKRDGDSVSAEFSDRSRLSFHRGKVSAMPPWEKRPSEGFRYAAEKFRDSHDEETIRAALERWSRKSL